MKKEALMEDAAEFRGKCYGLLHDLRGKIQLLKRSAKSELKLAMLGLAGTMLDFAKMDMDGRDDLDYAFWKSQYAVMLQYEFNLRVIEA